MSEFEQHQQRTGNSAYGQLEGHSVLPPTLLADLHAVGVGYGRDGGDVLEILAACMRHYEPALLLLKYQGLLWPVTVFPRHGLYHSPRNIVAEASRSSLSTLAVMSVEPPGVRPPGDRQGDRVGDARHFQRLGPLLWAMALHGSRRELLAEIDGSALYRALHFENSDEEPLHSPGAIGSALVKLRRDSVSLAELASWPGMNLDRASRLLNALYLATGLMVTRSSVQPTKTLTRLFSWGGQKRRGH